MSGGKGGSQSSQIEIPEYIEDAARTNIARAQAIQNMPYVPIMGPTMAGFTSGQKAGMESQAALAQRMGIIPQSYDVTAGYMPSATDVGGGLSAYSSYPGYKQRVEAAYAENPQLRAQMEALYGPETYQDFMRQQIVDKATASGTLDALVASGVLDGGRESNGSQVNLTAEQSYAANTPGALQFALAEAGKKLEDNPFGVITSPGTAILGGLANRNLERQGYTYVQDPNAVGGGYYSRDDRTYGDASELGSDATAGQKAAMSGWSE